MHSDLAPFVIYLVGVTGSNFMWWRANRHWRNAADISRDTAERADAMREQADEIAAGLMVNVVTPMLQGLMTIAPPIGQDPEPLIDAMTEQEVRESFLNMTLLARHTVVLAGAVVVRDDDDIPPEDRPDWGKS